MKLPPEKTSEEKFEFDPPMQDDLLKLMVRDQAIAEASTNWIKSEYFIDQQREWTAETIINFTTTFGMPPTHSEARQMLRVAASAGDITAAQANLCEQQIRNVYEAPMLGAKAYTIDQVKQFARQRAWDHAIMAAMPLRKQGKFAEMAALMQDANNAVFDLDTGVYWFFEAAKQRIQRRTLNEDDEQITPMGIMELDYLLRRKGFGPGESIVWIGSKGSGKSIILGHVSRRAVYDRKKVIIFTLEMREDQIADRQDSGFTGVDMWLMREQHERLQQEMEALAARFPKHMAIKRYPTGAGSINDMRRCLENLRKSEGWEPDFITLDYMGLVKPRRKHEKRYEEYRELSEDFRGLLGEYEVPGHTAAQLTRGGSKAHTAEGSDVAGMWDALATFDYIYVLNQDNDERKDKMIRIFIDKARDGKDKIEVGPLPTAWHRMQFVTRPKKYPWDRMKELDLIERQRD